MLAGILLLINCGPNYQCLKTKDLGDVALKLSWIPNTSQYILGVTESKNISGNVPLLIVPPLFVFVPYQGKLKDAVTTEYYFNIDNEDTSLTRIVKRFGEEGYGVSRNIPKEEKEKAFRYLRRM